MKNRLSIFLKFLFLLILPTPIFAESISDFSKLISVNQSCLDYKFVAPCICPGTPPYVCGWIAQHYLPVAIIEVIKGPGDSIFGGAGGPNTGTVNLISEDGTYRGAEVRIWEISDRLRSYAMLGVNCGLCDNQMAELQSGNNNAAGGSIGGGLTNQACGGGINDIVQKILDQALSANNEYIKLIYDTEFDTLNWRTGCRDMKQAATTAMSCLVNDAANTVDNLSFGRTNLSGTFGNEEVCIGSWQPLYPRQFKSVGISEPIAAGTAAYRAAHIAAKTIGKFKFEVSTDIHLQQAYPEQGDCIKPGAQIAEAEQNISVSENGRYGFIWWVKVRCCKKFDEVGGDCFGN